MPINTAFLLMAQYGGKAVIPLTDVRRDYFSHLTMDAMLRRIGNGELSLPVVRTAGSQKAWRGVHLVDLARYLDEQRETALKLAGKLVS